MNSPYYNGGGAPTFRPPEGLIYQLIARDREAANNAADAGRFIGSVGAGIGGLGQGARNPEVFGAGTSGLSGALQAGAMNFNAGYSGGGEATGFGGLKSGGGGQGGGSMNFKQLASLGKAADNFRAAIVQSQPTLGDQEPDVFGKDSEWKTLGAQEKFQRVQTAIQVNAQKSVLQQLALQGQQMQQNQNDMAVDAAFGKSMSQAQGQINNAALAEGNGPVRTRTPGLSDFAAVATPEAWRSRQAAPFVEAAAREQTAGKEYGPVQFTDVPGRPGAMVVTRDGYTSVIQPEASASMRDPLMEMDYRALTQKENELTAAISKARAARQLDTANQLAGELNSVKRRKNQLREGRGKPAAAPAPSTPAASRYTIIEE